MPPQQSNEAANKPKVVVHQQLTPSQTAIPQWDPTQGEALTEVMNGKGLPIVLRQDSGKLQLYETANDK